MGKWHRKRYLLGNIALVVFLAFLATLTWGATALAQIEPVLQVLDYNNSLQSTSATVQTSRESGSTHTLTLTFRFYPITPDQFSSVWFQVKKGQDTVVSKTYLSSNVISKTYVANYTYQFVYSWTYSFGTQGSYTGYGLYVGAGDTVYKYVALTVEVPPPETSGGGGGGGGAVTTPTGPVTTTQEATTTPAGGVTAAGSLTGAVSSSGQVTATLAVDAAKTLAALDKPEVKQLELVVPKEVKTEKGTQAVEQATIKVAAEVVAKALEAGKQVAVKVADAQLVIPHNALDLSALAGQGANLSINVTRTSASEASRPQDAAMKVAGDVYTIEIRVESKGEDKGGISTFKSDVVLTLTYDPSKLAAGEEQYLGAYRQEAGGWKYVGGRINRDARQVTVTRRSLSTYAVMAYIKTFADMAGHWADQAVRLMAARHVVAGMTPVNFVPDNNVTRAEFAAMLLRALMIEPSAAGQSFKDVDEGAWYAAVVKTAAAQGLVKGYDDGTFKPNQKITRQELAAMATRALAMKGLAQANQAEVESILKQFSDQGQVSKWARASMATAVKYGVVSGRTKTTCAPKATATRAEAATMVKNMLTALGEI